MITRDRGPCVFCRVRIQYGEHGALYNRQPYLSDSWLDKQIEHWSFLCLVYTRDRSGVSRDIRTGELTMGAWSFDVCSGYPDRHRCLAFETLEPFTCPRCAEKLRNLARPARICFEREHVDAVELSRAAVRRRGFVLIRGAAAR